jgi:uncharacterized delta-60 repeat protein
MRKRKYHPSFAILLLSGICASSFAADGDLDPDFGANPPGVFSVPRAAQQPVSDEASAIVVQMDGKVVAVGRDANSTTGVVAIYGARLTVSGTLDRTFGSAGTGVVAFTQSPLGLPMKSERARGVALQSDGKIVIAGFGLDATTSAPRGLLVRLNTNGTIDTSFRGGGAVGGLSSTVYNAITIDPRDDSILVAGFGIDAGKTDDDFYVAHYDKDGGKIGDKFIAYNQAGSDNGDYAYGIALSRDQIILVGQSDNSPYSSSGDPRSSCAVASVLLPDLALNSKFGSSFDPGKLTIGFDPYVSNPKHESEDTCYAAVIRDDGKVVVGGESIWTFAASQDSSDYSIAILDHGFVDKRFSNEFTAAGDVGNRNGIFAMALQNDNKVIFAGKAGINSSQEGPSNFGLGRVNLDGTLDTAFGAPSVGTITPPYDYSLAPGAGTVQYVTGVGLDAAGRPIAVGVNYFWDPSNKKPLQYANFLFMKFQNTPTVRDEIFPDGFEGLN